MDSTGSSTIMYVVGWLDSGSNPEYSALSTKGKNLKLRIKMGLLCTLVLVICLVQSPQLAMGTIIFLIIDPDLNKGYAIIQCVNNFMREMIDRLEKIYCSLEKLCVNILRKISSIFTKRKR